LESANVAADSGSSSPGAIGSRPRALYATPAISEP
jgi:hypothetical protein